MEGNKEGAGLCTPGLKHRVSARDAAGAPGLSLARLPVKMKTPWRPFYESGFLILQYLTRGSRSGKSNFTHHDVQLFAEILTLQWNGK